MPNQFRVEGGAWVSGRDHQESQLRKGNIFVSLQWRLVSPVLPPEWHDPEESLTTTHLLRVVPPLLPAHLHADPQGEHETEGDRHKTGGGGRL